MQGDTFAADGSDGKEYTVRIYPTKVAISTPEGTSLVPGPPDLHTTCGRRVTRIEKGKYRLDDGVILVSESNDAP
jgi:hypothetical protein